MLPLPPPPNPFPYTLPIGASINISCEANAAWQQRVTVTIPGDARSPYHFTGSGEPGDMILDNGRDAIELGPLTTPKTITFYYEFNSGGGFQPAARVVAPVVKRLPWGQFVTIAGEDGADSDENDSIIYINTSNVLGDETQSPEDDYAVGQWMQPGADDGEDGEDIPRGAKKWQKC
ncbi:uncharacterized protein N7477_009526 [Penicillium maclennaniae]|uniref:uncharacterized protein n=1 Tax=Penicillium maclennaniae TaxID=1343394 RepID=UPI00253F73E7|nr:uncharacterized protein N7477_009526 [Penicillium maclennaniae]KAJ5661910.1 hypothetical protein N7477_009526 [Penicillium maclennaniae]